MIIQPILAPTLSGLTATPALKGNLLKWSVLNDALLLGTEAWGSKTNDRTTAIKLATVYDNTFTHATEAGETWYYWIRAVSIYERSDGEWFPVSSSAGISATALLTQTTDIAPNSVTNISVAQGAGTKTQTSYSTWENIFSISFSGTGNKHLIDVSHVANASLTSVGTSQGVRSVERLTLNEYTVYSLGLATVTNGSKVIIGIGTSWLTSLVAGNYFFILGGNKYTIASVDSDTQITLAANYLGSTASSALYYVITNINPILVISQDTRNLSITGAYIIQSNQQFNHKWLLESVSGKLYDIILDWALARDNSGWGLSQSSVLMTVILQELKR